MLASNAQQVRALSRSTWLSVTLLLALCIGCSLHDEAGEGRGSGAMNGGSGASNSQNQGGLPGNSAGKSNGTSGSGTGGSGSGTSGSGTGGSGSGTGGTGAPVQTDFPDAQIYVDAHNAVRAAVEEPANYAGTWQPLPPVSWSDEVAITSQDWANHLRDTVDCDLQHESGTGYGENLAGGSDVGAQRAVDMWASEKANYDYSPEYEFESDTGHYTQIVWRSSIRIGCASASCGRSSVVVCRYDPPGNFIGGEIF